MFIAMVVDIVPSVSRGLLPQRSIRAQQSLSVQLFPWPISESNVLATVSYFGCHNYGFLRTCPSLLHLC